MKGLLRQHAPNDRKDYVPRYPGFEKLFQIGLEGFPKGTHIRWPETITQPQGDGTAEEIIYAAMNAALAQLDAVREACDVVLVHFPDSWVSATRTQFFDAHDVLKALGAKYGIHTQVLNDRPFTFGYRASVVWRLAIALYVKAGGIPWKLAGMPGADLLRWWRQNLWRRPR